MLQPAASVRLQVLAIVLYNLPDRHVPSHVGSDGKSQFRLLCTSGYLIVVPTTFNIDFLRVH